MRNRRIRDLRNVGGISKLAKWRIFDDRLPHLGDADAHSDVLTFKSPDNDLVEIDRRRITRVEQFNDGPDRPTPWPGLKMTPITVTYKPAVWSVGEGDEPHPATADIYSDYMEFEMWSGHTIREIDLKAA